MRYLVLILLCVSACFAADPPLPAEAQVVVDQYDKAVEAAKAKAVKALEAAKDACRHKGDTAGEEAITAKIASLKGQEVPAQTGERPSTPEDAAKQVQDGVLDIATYRSINGQEVTIDSNGGQVDLKIVVPKGERALVVPNPDDKWAGEVGNAYVGYAGEKNGNNWPRACLVIRCGEDDANAHPLVNGAIVTGPGKLYGFMFCPGAPKHIGKLRVKVVVLR